MIGIWIGVGLGFGQQSPNGIEGAIRVVWTANGNGDQMPREHVENDE